MTRLAALVLAAGEGRRLRPLTDIRPKPLCPVGNVALLDRALQRFAALVPLGPASVAVNAHHLAEKVESHVGGRASVSVERPEALGTAGAVGRLLEWLDGRDLLIGNGDVVFVPEVDVAGFVSGWDGERPRLLVVEDQERADFAGRWRFAGLSLLPWRVARTLPGRPAGLYETVWSRMPVDLVPTDVTYVDCGTPADYLRANLLLSSGTSVVDPTATVLGSLDRCVVWPHAVVHAGEHLVECIRARDRAGADVTVDASGPS